MTSTEPRGQVTATAVLILLIACGGGRASVVDVTLSEVDTVVAPGAEFFQQPQELLVGPDGRLFVTDVLASSVLVLTSAGERAREIGRSGSGPEEFNGPRSVTLVEGKLFVVDGGNGRLQRVTTDGIFSGPRSLHPAALRGAVSISPTGDMLISRNGRDSTLAILVDTSGVVVDRLGDPPSVLPPRFDFVAVKREIRAGQIPAMLRAITLPVLASDRSAWLVLVGEGEVQRYSSHGDHLWTTSLRGPELDSIRAEFFRRNREDDNPNQFVTLSYVVAARSYRENLWLLLRMPEDRGAVFQVLDQQGSLAAHVRVPSAVGIRSFAADPKSRDLYMLDFYGGAVLRTRLPEELTSLLSLGES